MITPWTSCPKIIVEKRRQAEALPNLAREIFGFAGVVVFFVAMAFVAIAAGA